MTTRFPVAARPDLKAELPPIEGIYAACDALTRPSPNCHKAMLYTGHEDAERAT